MQLLCSSTCRNHHPLLLLLQLPPLLLQWSTKLPVHNSEVRSLPSGIVVALTWLHMVKSAVSSLEDVCWRIMIWTVAFVTLPFQFLTALPKEKMLEGHLHDLQFHLETLVWEKDELQRRLRKALKDHKMMETMLTEAEEEHGKAIAKINLLKNELQDLKEESARLHELRGKDPWDFKAQDSDPHHVGYREPAAEEYGVSTWDSGSGVLLHDLKMHDEHGTGSYQQKTYLLKPESKVGRLDPFSTRVISRNTMVVETLDQRRSTAILRSLFSTMLSLLVGMVIWEAKSPCLPLVVALFCVVAISLKSVVQFFSTIKVRPASDAVALLSFNFFILGTITFPTLPTVARMVFPPSLRLGLKVFSWIGSFLGVTGSVDMKL